MTTQAPPRVATQAQQYTQLIGGQWMPAADGATVDVLNPYDGSVYATVPASSRVDAAGAVLAAASAQPAWAETAPAAKQTLFLKAADLLEARVPEIVRALAEETGSGAGFAHFQIHWSANLLRQAAGWVYHPHGEMLRTEYPHTLATAERKPLGVVASFAPWNGAHVLAWRAVVAPLAAGNTVVLKPSEEAPVTAGLLVGEILTDAGFPAGVVNVVCHAGSAAPEIAEEFYENPAVRCLYFTGSATTGRIIASRAGNSLKRSVMELGGYNQMIVLDDADLDQAARIVAFSAFFHQGQICMNARRILVQRPVYSAFVERLVGIAGSLSSGDPRDPATIIGPLINDRALGGTRNRVDEAVRAGARILTGGTHNGRIYAPTVVAEVPDDNELSCEETFGPVVVVRPVEDDEEGIRLVNENPYGLSCSVLTGHTGRGMGIAARIDSGAVHVNTPTVNDEPQSPLGGVKNSGWGRSGLHAIEDFTEVRWMTVEMGERQLPL